jgi:hypothetical protein
MKLYLSLTVMYFIPWIMTAQRSASDSSFFAMQHQAMGFCAEAPSWSVNLRISESRDGQTAKRPSAYGRWIIPALGIAYGTAARFNETPMRRFDKYVGKQVETNIHRQYRIDDYLQMAPAVAAMGLDFVPGIQSRHNLRDRTLILATSYLCMGGVVFTMKNRIDVLRPRGQGYNSFPSGHTAIAFMGAHVLYREYRDQSPWIGVGGYAAATATGLLRVVNKAHWVSDVVAGAGIGILSAEVGYLMLPVWHRLFGLTDSRQMVIMPSVSAQEVGAGVMYLF